MRLLDLAILGPIWLTLIALAMVLERQPARRRLLARGGLVGSLLLVPIVLARPEPEIDLPSLVGPWLPPWNDRIFRGWTDWDDPTSTLAGLGGLRFARLVGWGYMALALSQIAGLVLGGWGARWLVRKATRGSSESCTLLESLGEPGKPVPRLGVSTRVASPVLIGGPRATILIPPGLDRPESHEVLRPVFCHELAHEAGRDPLFGWVAGLARSLWCYCPAAWWIVAQARLDQEFLADRIAAARSGGEAAYASILFRQAGPETTELPADAARRAGRPAAWTGGPALFQRMLMLLACPFPVERRPTAWYRAACLTGMAIVLVGLAGLGGAAREWPGRPHEPAPRVLRIPRLAFEAQARPLPYPLPFDLPESFRIRAEFHTDHPEMLGDVRLSGWSLPVPPTSSQEGVYHFELERNASGFRASWDGVGVPTTGPPPAPGRLTITPPPGEPLEIRRLEMLPQGDESDEGAATPSFVPTSQYNSLLGDRPDRPALPGVDRDADSPRPPGAIRP